MMFIEVDSHPLLDPVAIRVELSTPQGTESPPWLQKLLEPGNGPEELSQESRKAVRSLLRHGGYRPAGRGKPSSEWLVKAAAQGRLGSILPLVDAGNAASRAEGIPLSVIDLDRVQPPLTISLGQPGERYIFNRSDQQIDVEGLICLRDRAGPLANAVKDSQRCKTDDTTRRALILVWGTVDLPGAATRLAMRVQDLVSQLGADTEGVEFRRSGGEESLLSGPGSH
jgi:DNA/RNA-binding domain of Phe-tRNA-synthetase-like protein